MRKRNRRGYFEELNRQVVFIGILFIISMIVGTYLNKIWPSYQSSIVENVDSMTEFYNSNISLKDAIIINAKSDFVTMSLICIFTLLAITFPVSIVLFILKGISIGYTISSIMLVLKIEGMKMIILTLCKNLFIIPGLIILTVFSFDYIKKVIIELKNKKRESMFFLGSRYLINSLIVLMVAISTQALLNIVIIGIIKFLVK